MIEQVPLQNTLESVEKEAVMAKCTIRCNYEPCNVIIQFDREDELKDVFAPLSNWKDLVYDKKCSLLDGNRKSCTMVIPSINSHYYGDYRCTWWEISNRNNNESFYFLLGTSKTQLGWCLEFGLNFSCWIFMGVFCACFFFCSLRN